EPLAKWHHSISCFVKGFRMLPVYWGVVYRGVADVSEELIKKWTRVGEIILFEAFTSTSLNREITDTFSSGKNPVIFIIHSKSGRELTDLSFFEHEVEVVFRPSTYFRVMKWEEKTTTSGSPYKEIILHELYPDIRGRKVVLWIDDNPP